jgi:tRNA nucleotidyltransferase (CCA-adding enzyme)
LLQKVCERLRVPTDCKELAEVVAREHGNIHRSAELGPEALMRLLERCDAIRQAERFERVLQACECDARGRLGFEEAAYPQAARLQQAQKLLHLELLLAIATNTLRFIMALEMAKVLMAK